MLTVIATAALGTVRARQVWAGHQAHSSASVAQGQVTTQLRLASSKGMLATELRPFVARFQVLNRRRLPSSNLLWGATNAAFYRRQTRAYRHLSRDLSLGLVRATNSSRAATTAQAGRVAGEIVQASKLEVAVNQAKQQLNAVRLQLKRAATPKEFRSLQSSLERSYQSLKASVAPVQTYVSAALNRNRRSLGALVTEAGSHRQALDSKLFLLGLFSPRASAYRSSLDADLSNVQSSRNAFTAAVKAFKLNTDGDALSRSYEKVVPGKVIVVSTESQSASAYQGGVQVYAAPVTTGGPDLPTDHGVFHIYFRASPFTFHSPWPPGSPYYYPPTDVQYWMPFYGGEGLHDASWRSNFGAGSNLAPTDLGTGNTILGTHGCVNLPLPAAQFFWDWAPMGTAVVVI